MTLQHFVQEPQDFPATVKEASRCSGSSIPIIPIDVARSRRGRARNGARGN
jgi:hypothetical protein